MVTIFDMEEPAGAKERAPDDRERDRDVGVGAERYEPPRLHSLGSLSELTRGITGQSDGLGPGSALA